MCFKISLKFFEICSKHIFVWVQRFFSGFILIVLNFSSVRKNLINKKVPTWYNDFAFHWQMPMWVKRLDFNIHHKDWLTYSRGTDRSGELCYNFSISNDLTQIVNFPTWIPDCDSHSPALLDLFLSSDANICSTMAFPPLGNSDHVAVSVSIGFIDFNNKMHHFIVLLVTIFILIGMVFVVIWEMFHAGFYPSTFLQPVNSTKNSILNWVLTLNLFKYFFVCLSRKTLDRYSILLHHWFFYSFKP